MSGRPTVARVDLDALAHNYRTLVTLVSGRSAPPPASASGSASAPASASVDVRTGASSAADADAGAGSGARGDADAPEAWLADEYPRLDPAARAGAASARVMAPSAASPASAPAPDVIGVVKANAYGHGAPQVALALEAAGAPMLACADIDEGVSLRRAGVRVPILVFGALSIGDVEGLFEFTLTPTVSTPSAVRTLEQAAARRGVTLGCHLKIDTGMNRLGFRHDQLDRTMPPLLASPHLRVDAVYTHFATADQPDDPLFGQQRERFDQAWTRLRALGLGPVRRHAANSAALLRDERIWLDAVRPGLLIYGLVPPPLASTLPLKPVMRLTSRITAVKGIRPGEGVSYGMRFRADSPRRVAVVPAGYADGLDTRLGNHGVVLVRGRRAPIVGAVCMDMLMIDVTDQDADPGDEVVLLGEQGQERIDAREMAAAIGSIPWEIICRIGTRIERIYERPV